ncbi:MAG: DNA modification methylase [Chloroflexota bacterium]
MSGELILDPRNARRHSEENQAFIRQSLQQIGGFRSIAIDGENIIRAGNGVYEQAKALGLKIRIIEAAKDELIAVKRPDLTGELAERAAILDNRSSETSEWAVDVLNLIKESNPSAVEGLWDDKEWRDLLAQAEQPEADTEALPEPKADKAEELRSKWATAPGQLWEIPSIKTPGKAHRLLCGDSTSAQDVTCLMNGERAVLFSTDPPYLVNYDGTNHPHKWGEKDGNKDWSGHYQDWDKAEDGDGLYDGFISMAVAHAITGNAAWYCWHASRNQIMVEQAWNKYGAFVHQQIIWAKDRPILTRSWYLWKHEPCFFGWVKGKKPNRTSDEFMNTVWELRVPDGEDRVEHPTQKPIEVFLIPMLQHTLPGELCYEPFSGSGSQLVAAESAGRICYAMEKSPAFVAVNLERLAGLGLEPRLLG